MIKSILKKSIHICTYMKKFLNNVGYTDMFSLSGVLHSFLQNQIFFWCNFYSAYRTSLSFSFSAGLLETNCFSFCQSKIYFTFEGFIHWIWNLELAGIFFFFLLALNDVMPTSFGHCFWWEASCYYYFLIWNRSSHPPFWKPICFQDFLFLFVFSNLTIMCLSVDFSAFSLFGVCWSCICELMPFNTFGKVSAIIFLKISSISLSLLWNPNHVCVCVLFVLWIFPSRLYHLSFDLIHGVIFHSVHRFEHRYHWVRIL